MKNFHSSSRILAAVLTLAFGFSMLTPVPALADTTGTISGTIYDAVSGAPIANAAVDAASPSGSRSTKSDQHGFYILQALLPDTYTVSVVAQGYEPLSQPGITVQQDQTTAENVRLARALKTIASVTSRAAGNLVQPNVTSDVYNVSGAQLNAIAGGNDLHKTLYQYVAAIPGVTGSGFPAQPRIHGGSAADIAYEFDGVPINERITGLFTTNLSNVGIGNVEVFTGGLDAKQAASGLGIINTVVKTGTYPPVARFSYGTTTQYSNQFYTAELGGATPNHKFAWYFSLDKTNSLNQWVGGATYPAYLIEQANGPGVVKTTDIIANFHFRPDANNDFQLLFQNGLGEFNWGYLMQRAPGEPQPLTAMPCAGATPDLSGAHLSWSGGVGGTAPNGQPCPLGLFFGTANTQQAGGNIWHHYSTIGKLQWNHIIDDHSALTAKVALNWNAYVFDQPVVDANLAQFENSPDFFINGNTVVPKAGGGFTSVPAPCPMLPYLPGTPIQSVPRYSTVTGLQTTGKACDQEFNWLSTGYWQVRESHMWLGSVDYTIAPNANTTISAGIGDEFDQNAQDVYYTDFFNTDGSWPAVNYRSDFPTIIPYAYASAKLRAKKWLFSPGVRFTRETYLTPIKSITADAINPTFSFNYTAGANDVIRGSFTNTNSFVGSAYVYRYAPPNALNGYAATTPYCATNSTNGCAIQPDPTVLHSWDLQWEHQFNHDTSVKFGPWGYRTTNIYQTYTPYNCVPQPPPGTALTCTVSGPALPSNGGIRQAFGLEFGLNHEDHNTRGVSYWVSATYDNFWASSLSSLTTPWGIAPIPPAAVARGNLLRSSADPLFSGTVTLDAHFNNVHFLPLVYYQSPVVYYTGSFNSATGQITALPNQPVGWWIVNATLLADIGKTHDLTIGVQGQNIFNNSKPISPCTATQLGSTPSLGIGCSPLWPVGTGSIEPGLSGPGLGYPTGGNQSAPLFMFFLSKRIP
jgi:hypothetical protein